jgi:hypothetical protein
VTAQQPYAVRLSPAGRESARDPARTAEQTAWDVLDAAAGNPSGFPQWDPSGPESEDVRIASVGQLSVVYFANHALRHLSVLDVVWLG